MTSVTRRSFVGAVACAMSVPPAQASSGRRPQYGGLATEAQQRFDARTVSILRRFDFGVAQAEARAAYLGAHLGPTSREALSRLDNAIAELTTGMLKTAVNNDPYRPGVYWVGSQGHTWLGNVVPGSRWAFDNPDTIYRTIPIDPDSHYVVHGEMRGTGTADFAFSLINDLITQTMVGFVDGQALRNRDRRRYTLTVGPDPARGRRNHLQTTSDTVQLFVRSIVAEWSTQRPDHLWVERVDRGPRPAPRADSTVAAEARELLMEGAAIFGPGLLGAKTMAHPVNTFPQPGKTPGALVTQANTFGHFQLRDDEALVINLDPGGSGYCTVPVTDPWMVGVDPGRSQSSLNNHQGRLGRDGRLTCVVSRRDPGYNNWVSTAGRSEGTIMIRWQRLPADGGSPAVSAEVTPFADLAAALPSGFAKVTPRGRAQALVARRTGYLTRFNVR